VPPSTSTGDDKHHDKLWTSPHNSRIKLKSTELKGGSQKKQSGLDKRQRAPGFSTEYQPREPGNDPTSTPWTPVTTRHRAFKWTFFSRSGLFGGKSGIPGPGAESERFPWEQSSSVLLSGWKNKFNLYHGLPDREQPTLPCAKERLSRTSASVRLHRDKCPTGNSCPRAPVLDLTNITANPNLYGGIKLHEES